MSNKVDVAQARDKLVQYFRDSEFEYFYLFFCSWGNGRPRAKTSVVDMSYYYFGDWFA